MYYIKKVNSKEYHLMRKGDIDEIVDIFTDKTTAQYYCNQAVWLSLYNGIRR
jgi:uncharacterized beta-barrel protein YwiB (DUF1934 family)